MSKRILILIIPALLLCLGLAACEKSHGQIEAEQDRHIQVVATLFPQYDFIRQVGGDKVDLKLLLPPGTESHSYEPTPSDVLAINNADLFVFTGANMEPWAQKIADSIEKSVAIIDVSQGIVLEKHQHEDEGDHGDDHDYDPHIWLDPQRAITMLTNIEEALCEHDPQNEAFYRRNAAEYRKEIETLDRDILTVVEAAPQKTIVFGGRFAYCYFIERYALDYESVYDGCSSEAEPSVRRVSEIISYIKEHDIKVIYHEEFVDPVVARSIAEETGAKLLLFSTCHNITKDELSDGLTYIDLMRRNLENLKEGLQ